MIIAIAQAAQCGMQDVLQYNVIVILHAHFYAVYFNFRLASRGEGGS